MQKKRVIIVISDVHIGAGKLDDFDAELESCFCKFLEELTKEKMPVEFVINGDFLDFVQADPWESKKLRSKNKNNNIPLCFTEDQFLEKLTEIHKQHQKVFGAIGSFLAKNKENHLTIIPGNHDVDFFWDKVRENFTEKISPVALSEQLSFHLEQVYIPSGFPNVRIEHGHQYDRINSFYINEKPCWSQACPPIFDDERGVKRLYECTGTRFLNKYLNKLDLKYPFVDNVKPFKRFLKIFGSSALVPGYGPLNALVAVCAMKKFFFTTLFTTRHDLLDHDDLRIFDPRPGLNRLLDELTPKELSSFVDNLQERNYKINIPLSMIVKDREKADQLLDFLADNFDLIPDIGMTDPSFLSAAHEDGMLDLTKGFFVDETNELIKAAKNKKNSNNSVDIIIMGHTHEKIIQTNPLNYINTGCWTRYYHFEEEEKTRPWSFLKDFLYERFPYQLNYVKIVHGYDKPLQLSMFRERFK